MITLNLELGKRSYPIYIGNGIINDSTLIQPHLVSNQVVIVTNDTIAPIYLQQVQDALANYNVHTVILPDGESHKNLATWSQIIDALLTYKATRHCTLIALGGGVIGDMTGFAAACYQRGIAFLQIPTTLLAQVDASVGGKTGINHPLGKNMIGAFYQPRCVIIDTNTLNTLPKREFIAGISEIIKYGLIRDQEFFAWLESSLPEILDKDPKIIARTIELSCQNKADIVAADEQETGQRALLNLGHTFGHAIETNLGYGKWLHGEAVAVGISMAAELSARLGWLTITERDRIIKLITQAELPTKLPSNLTKLSVQQFLKTMA
ncbi:3-dehydroquinate synthase, partial [Achromatium sp. WMS3]